MEYTRKLNSFGRNDEDAIADCLKELFGSVKGSPWTGPDFQCDSGTNISVGDCFIATCNVDQTD